MKTIRVCGYTVQVDDEDYLLCLIRGLSIRQAGPYLQVIYSGGKFSQKSLSRTLMGNPEGLIVDHKDGDTLNNCKENLRTCNHAQSMQNRGNWGASKFKGVYRNKDRWASSIYFDGKKKYLGTFATQEEAAEKYRKAAAEIQGEFASHSSRSVIDNP